MIGGKRITSGPVLGLLVAGSGGVAGHRASRPAGRLQADVLHCHPLHLHRGGYQAALQASRRSGRGARSPCDGRSSSSRRDEVGRCGRARLHRHRARARNDGSDRVPGQHPARCRTGHLHDRIPGGARRRWYSTSSMPPAPASWCSAPRRMVRPCVRPRAEDGEDAWSRSTFRAPLAVPPTVKACFAGCTRSSIPISPGGAPRSVPRASARPAASGRSEPVLPSPTARFLGRSTRCGAGAGGIRRPPLHFTTSGIKA